ncbi:hypothetical protein STEG23_027400, partial [Scotinomys teguina]
AAYGESGYSRVGNPKERQKEKMQRWKRRQPAAQGARKYQQTVILDEPNVITGSPKKKEDATLLILKMEKLL